LFGGIEMGEYDNNNNPVDFGPFVPKRPNDIKDKLPGYIVLAIILIGVLIAIYGIIVTEDLVFTMIGFAIVFVAGISFFFVSSIGRKKAIKSVKSDPYVVSYAATIVKVDITSRTETLNKVTVHSTYTISINEYPAVLTKAFGTEQYLVGTVINVKVNPKKPEYCLIEGGDNTNSKDFDVRAY
jgi:hypothetical protein